MSMNAGKLVKYTIKIIAKATEIDYDELKDISKKALKILEKWKNKKYT